MAKSARSTSKAVSADLRERHNSVATDTAGVPDLDRKAFKYSVVIPVFNSEAIVGETIDRVVRFFEDAGLKFELVLINDGSRDGSWSIVKQRALGNPTSWL